MDPREFFVSAESTSVTLVVRRTIHAAPEQLFEAWTHPEHLKQWWGPRGVTCVDAEIDLRVGGSYRIANQLPDGSVLWIRGEFEIVEPPHTLAYTWRVDSQSLASERVTVTFQRQGEATEVIVRHERIPDLSIRERHELGWEGCLDRLANYLDRSAKAI